MSKVIAVLFMIIGVLLCIPLLISILFPPWYVLVPVLLFMLGGPLFFAGFSALSRSGQYHLNQTESDIARVRFVEETNLRRGK